MDQQNKLIIPGAIVIAGVLIAGAVYFSGNSSQQPTGVAGASDRNNPESASEISFDNEDFSDDYIFGNPEAPIKLVEYSDTNCRYCRALHPTMKRIMEEYGDDGQVAWIYRHFSVLGPSSVTQAQALECAGEMGGNEKFWEYLDHLFVESKSENGQFLPGESIESVASAVGLNVSDFNACVASEKYAGKVDEHTRLASEAGGRGTPFTLLVNSDGQATPIAGAQPFENFRAAIENALSEL